MLDKRSIANFKLSILVAKESRTYPGAPKAEPGTKAKLILSRQ